MPRILACICLTVASCGLHAQSSCEAVYASSTRNIDGVSRQLVEYSNLYNKHCEKNGSMRLSSSGTDLSVGYSEIEFGWKGTNAEAQSAMQNFCRVQHDQRELASSLIENSSVVVTSALDAFNQCKLIESESLYLSHTSTTDSVVVRGAFASPAKVEVQAVRYDSNAGTCWTTSISPPKAILLNEKTKVFYPKGPFSISCTRKGVALTNGTMKYPAFELLVVTNSITYPVKLPAEDVFDINTAKDNKRLIANNKTQEEKKSEIVVEKSLKVNLIKARLDGIKITSHRIDALSGEGFQGVCAPPSKLAGTPTFINTHGGCCGYYYFAYSCMTIPD